MDYLSITTFTKKYLLYSNVEMKYDYLNLVYFERRVDYNKMSIHFVTER